ncbi:MAG: oligosaccharide flippase family protein [Sedimentisphaerales bacterium]|nr:oligosaccharide flippase family protein [Sedimentisphaerales bacterium]
MASLRKRVMMNAGSNWAGMFVTAAVSLILVRIMWRSLGVDAFGVWALLSSGLRYPMIFETAFSLSTNRFVAFYRDDSEQLCRFVSASFIVLLTLSVLTIAAAIILSFFVSGFFAAITEEQAADAQVTCMLVGVTLALKMLEATFSGTLRGFQYDTRVNAVLIASNLLRLIFTVAILFIWKSIVAVQLAFGLSAAVSLVSMFFVARKSIPGFEINIFKIKKETIRELFRYTGHATGRSGSMIFMFSTLALLVGKVGSAQDVAVYDVATRIPNFTRGLLAGAQNVFLPVVTSLFAAGHIEKMKAVIRKGTHISCVITCVFVLLLFIYAEEIFVFWLKDKIVPEMVLVMRLLMLSEIARGFFGIWLASLVGMGHLRSLTIAAITSAIGAIAVEIILLNGFVPVPVAPAAAMIIALWAYMGLWLPFYGLRKSGIGFYEYFRGSLLGPLAATIVSIGALWLFNHIVPSGRINWAILFAASGLIVLVCFTVISLRSEAAELLDMLRTRLGKGRQNLV